MRRRPALTWLSGGIITLAGCTQLGTNVLDDSGDGSRAAGGCDEMQKTMVDVNPISLSDEQLSNLYPFMYTDLQMDHRRIIKRASGDGQYEVCPPKPDPLGSFIDGAERRIERQWEEYGGDPADRPEYLLTPYLKRDNSYFGLAIAIEDLVLSG